MKLQDGFTLIELMIVIVVISILAAVGYPSYTDYVIRGKLAQATAGLADGRIKMEQFFQDNRTYVGAPCPSASDAFSFACSNETTTTYTITATGTASNMTSFTYTIDQANAKGSTTPWGNSTTCWVVKKGGGC